jgi:hypothetical protein
MSLSLVRTSLHVQPHHSGRMGDPCVLGRTAGTFLPFLGQMRSLPQLRQLTAQLSHQLSQLLIREMDHGSYDAE